MNDTQTIPTEFQEAARLAPDHWLGLVDPTWSGTGTPPRWAVVGEWRSGLDGEIEEWRPNEEYRPSPRARGWPTPVDAVDEAVQLAATGYGPGDDVTRRLATAEVAVPLAPDGGPLLATTPDGEPVVPLFTSAPHLQAAGRWGHEVMPVPWIVGAIPPGYMLYLNPSGPVSMTVDAAALREAVAELDRTAKGADDANDANDVNDAGDGEAPGPTAPESSARPATVGGGIPVTPVVREAPQGNPTQ